MEQNRVKELMDKLISYLKKNLDYPDDCFAVEYSLSRNYCVDLAIIDRTLNIPIMLFELKITKNSDAIRNWQKQVRNYLVHSEIKNIPFYLVVPADTDPFFEAFEIDPLARDEDQDVYKKNKGSVTLPKFKHILNTKISEVRDSKNNKKRKKVKQLQWVCWLIAAVLIVIGLLMAYGYIFLTTREMYIFGIAIVLILCPYVSSINILGIEIKMFEEKVDSSSTLA